MPASPPMPTFEKPPEDLTARFADVMAGYPDAPIRKTFGSPCAYVNGNMALGLHSTGWFVKLPPDAAIELLDEQGGTPFMPMPGRTMGGFYVLPGTVVADDVALRSWIERSLDYARSLPPKASAAKR